jgi:hypothetical protein
MAMLVTRAVFDYGPDVPRRPQPPGSYVVRHLRVPIRLDRALRRLAETERRKVGELMLLFIEDGVISRLGPRYRRAKERPPR